MSKANQQPSHSDQLHAVNWAGSVPIILTLAARSNSSPTLPPPIHALVPRHSFLHIALEDAVRRLHAFAPPSFTGFALKKREEPDPGSMYVEEEKEEKASAIAEVKASPTTAAAVNSEIKTSAFPVCWFEDEETQTALRWHFFAGVLFDLRLTPHAIPWKIRLHFTSYPSTQLLSLADGDVPTHVRSAYKNSLKQAMSLHYGNAKPALNMTKENHGKIWDAIRTANYNLYKQAHSGLPKQSSLRVPVRVLVDGGPPVQKPCLATDQLTLGGVLRVSAPDHFDDEGARESVVDWRMAGLSKAELSTPILHYWVNLAHPDHFLYITVLTR